MDNVQTVRDAGALSSKWECQNKAQELNREENSEGL